MIVVLAFMLLGGMPSGLAAFLQADAKGWRYLGGFALVFLAGLALALWTAAGTDFSNLKAVADLEADPRVTAGIVVSGVMLWAFVGAVVGKAFEKRVEPVSLGLRTAVVASVVQFGLIMSGIV